MIGKKKGVAGCLLKKNNKIIIRGCPCHLIHLAAEKAAKTLPYQFDEILVDLFYYLEKSANRKQELAEFQNLNDTETQRILKHVCTSMGVCLSRLIEQWVPLRKYFESKMKDDDRHKSDTQQKKDVKQVSESNEVCGQNDGSKSKTCTKQKCSNGREKSSVQNSKQQTVLNFASQTSSTSVKKTNKSIPKSDVGKGSTGLQEENRTYIREQRLYKLLSSRRCAVYAVFLQNCVQVFDKFNTMLQTEEPLI